jgi:hypothetical protein
MRAQEAEQAAKVLASKFAIATDETSRLAREIRAAVWAGGTGVCGPRRHFPKWLISLGWNGRDEGKTAVSVRYLVGFPRLPWRTRQTCIKAAILHGMVLSDKRPLRTGSAGSAWTDLSRPAPDPARRRRETRRRGCLPGPTYREARRPGAAQGSRPRGRQATRASNSAFTRSCAIVAATGPHRTLH